MTGAARIRATKIGAAGFTLLEIVFVLFIVAIIVGGAVGVMMLSDDERALKSATGEIEALAKRARTVAALQQRPYALEFSGNRITLMPLAEAMVNPGERERAMIMMDQAAATGGQAGNNFERVSGGWELAEGMHLSVRRWASDTWNPINNKTREVWRFDPEGFCEPVAVQISTEKSWMQAEFHPLTGSIRYTSSEIY